MAISFKQCESRVEAWRADARLLAEHQKATARQQRQQFVGPYRPGTPSTTPFDTSAIQFDDAERSRRQYEANKDTVQVATRPLVVTAAAQPFRVGFKATRKTTKDVLGEHVYKSLNVTSVKESRSRLARAPEWLTKEVGQDVTQVNDHFLLTLLQTPNELMTGYALKLCSFASMALTGRYVWWFDMTGGPRTDVPELGNLRLWYLPRSWISRPNPRDVTRWRIRAPGMASGYEVSSGELFMSTMPDPGNPFMPFSYLQAQAKAVDTEDKVLKAQAISMDNCMRPNLIMTVGRLPGMPVGGGRSGPEYRPILTPEQRGQLIDALRLMNSSVQKYGEPMILDGLIEDVKPFLPSPAELDMLNSSNVLEGRIMKGFGTSPVIAGWTQNANRAGSVVAKEVMYEFALNPMIEQASQDMDAVLGPRFTPPGTPRLKVWIDKAVADDPDSELARMQAFSDAVTLEEKRAFISSGRIKLDDLTPEAKAELQQAALKAVAGAVPKEVVTGEPLKK